MSVYRTIGPLVVVLANQTVCLADSCLFRLLIVWLIPMVCKKCIMSHCNGNFIKLVTY